MNQYKHLFLAMFFIFGLAGCTKELSEDIEPDRYVALPNLVDQATKPESKRAPDLLLPKVFRIYQRDDKGKLIEQLRATAVTKEFDHPAQFVKSARITPGYEVPLVAFKKEQFTEKQR